MGSAAGCENLLIACETKISVTNESSSSSTYDVVIDGVRVGAVSPGQSAEYNVTPGSHIVQINFANGGAACSAAAPSVAECNTFGLSCRA